MSSNNSRTKCLVFFNNSNNYSNNNNYERYRHLLELEPEVGPRVLQLLESLLVARWLQIQLLGRDTAARRDLKRQGALWILRRLFHCNKLPVCKVW